MDGPTTVFGIVIIGIMVFLGIGTPYIIYEGHDPLTVNISNVSDADMPIEIYIDGELANVTTIPKQGSYTYEHPKPPFDWPSAPSVIYTVSIRAPNTIYERAEQEGVVYFVLD